MTIKKKLKAKAKNGVIPLPFMKKVYNTFDFADEILKVETRPVDKRIGGMNYTRGATELRVTYLFNNKEQTSVIFS